MIPLLLGMIVAPLIQQDEVMAPLPPDGTNAAYQQGIKDVSTLLEAGDFSAASTRIKNLPDKAVSVGISFEGIDPETQKIFTIAAEQSFQAWKEALPELTFKKDAKPKIKISLVSSIPPGADGEKTLVLFPSPDPSEPAVEAVLALKRLSSKIPIDANVMTAEINFIIGQYLGLEQVPNPLTTMFRLDGFGARTIKIDPNARQLAQKTLEQVRILTDHARKREKIVAAFPEMFLATKDLDFGSIIQGENQQFQLEIVNRGKAPLNFAIRPDCSCFALDFSPTVQPGQTGIVTIYMSTKDFQGHQDKGLFLYTNDAENAITRISVHGLIRPAYRLRAIDNEDKTYLMTDAGLKISYFLYADGELPFEPRKAAISGVSGVASIRPWEGEITDPELFEGKQVRKGYQIEILLSPSVAVGRNLVALLVQTDSEEFPSLGANFFVQKGVAVNPKSIYFGDIDSEIAQASVILTGSNNSFLISSVESSEKRFSPKVEKVRDGEFRLTVTLNPGDTKGTIIGSILVKTNDPHSPTISIPVQGYVR